MLKFEFKNWFKFKQNNETLKYDISWKFYQFKLF